jgi:hypothetical protein
VGVQLGWLLTMVTGLQLVVRRGGRRLVVELAGLHPVQDDLSFLFNGLVSDGCCLSS